MHIEDFATYNGVEPHNIGVGTSISIFDGCRCLSQTEVGKLYNSGKDSNLNILTACYKGDNWMKDTVFEVGDRVEIVGQPEFLTYSPVNIMGEIIDHHNTTGSFCIKHDISNKDLWYSPSSLKLIKKGKDMEQEIKVGQVWEVEIVCSASWDVGDRFRITKPDDGDGKTRYQWISGRKKGMYDYYNTSTGWLREQCKLISEGEVKTMEKAKGKMLKRGDWVYKGDRADNYIEGKILSSKGVQYVCESVNSGLFIGEFYELNLSIQPAKEDIEPVPVNPKVKKAVKKKPAKKKKVAPKKKK